MARGVTRYSIESSPVADLVMLAGEDGVLSALFFREGGKAIGTSADWKRDDAAFAPVRDQLRAYFAGDLKVFDLPLAPIGTPFQQRVWKALTLIPYGATTTYGALATRLGDPRSVRAVGLANGRNPLPIIIPCHRVIGANGTLVGYGGGLERKRWLLTLEGSTTPPLGLDAC